MKKIIAIALAALMLLVSVAFAETLTVSGINATVNGKSVDLGALTAKATVGNANGKTTIQASVSDGAIALASGTAQIVGDKLVVAVDGMNKTYAIGLSNGAVSEALTAVLGSASLANVDVSGAINAVTSKLGDGASIKLPTGKITGLLNKAMKYADKFDAASIVSVPAVKSLLNKFSGTANVDVKYNKDTGAAEFTATLNGATVKGTANVTVAADEAALGDLDAANAIDITALTAEQRTELKNALNPILNSIAGYAVSAGLTDLLPAA